jgi:inhibitor of cysteine peptidase
MKRPSWIIAATIAIAVIAVAAGACGGGGKSINVDASYSGKQVQISVGDSLIVTLPSDVRTGYIWTATISDDRILHELDNKYVGQVGVGGKDLWTFKALKKATATVSMKYIRPGEEDVPPLNTFFLTVIVN